MNLVRAIGLWSPVISFMVLVLAYAEQGPPLVTLPIWDKAVHASAYALLGLFALRATHGRITRLRLGPLLVALAITVGFGAIDEWNQGRFSYRDSSLEDLAADTLGGLAAVGMVGLWSRSQGISSAEAQPFD